MEKDKQTNGSPEFYSTVEDYDYRRHWNCMHLEIYANRHPGISSLETTEPRTKYPRLLPTWRWLAFKHPRSRDTHVVTLPPLLGFGHNDEKNIVKTWIIFLVRGIKDTKKVLMFWQGKTLLYECGGHGSSNHPLSSLSWKFALAVSTLTFSCLFSSDSHCRTQFKGYSLVTFSKGQYPIATVIAYSISVLFHLSPSSSQILCSRICVMCADLVNIYLFL